MPEPIRARIQTSRQRWTTTHITTEVRTDTSTGRRLVLRLDDGTRIEIQLGRAIDLINQMVNTLEMGTSPAPNTNYERSNQLMEEDPNQHPLTEQELMYAKTAALLTLARLRGDAEEMDLQLALLCESLTIKQIIGALTTELAHITAEHFGSTQEAQTQLMKAINRMDLGA